MANAYASAKVKVSIGGTTAAATASEFAALTWTEVTGTTDIGEFGDDVEIINVDTIDTGTRTKLKGVVDWGDMELVVVRDPADAGQVALRTALGSTLAHNFKVELTDKPATGASPKNTVIYFRALVASGKNQIGGVNDPTKQSFKLAISGVGVTVPASAT